jgi:antitoxin ParD1/3/4
MATMNISLPDPMKDWVDERLKDGRFANTSDYVRHLIRLDRERQEAITAVQQAVDEGLSSGTAQPLDFADFKARMRKYHRG